MPIALPFNIGYLNNGGDGSTDTVTITTHSGSVTANDQLILMVGATEQSFAGSPSITSVTGGGTWAKAIASAWTVQDADQECWFLQSATGGSITVTITLSSACASTGMTGWLAESSGIGGIDGIPASATGNGFTADSPSLTPSVPGDLVIMFEALQNGPGTGLPGSPWTNDNTLAWFGGTPGAQIEFPISYQIATSTSTQSTTWTQTSGGNWNGLGVAFLPTAFSGLPGLPLIVGQSVKRGSLY